MNSILRCLAAAAVLHAALAAQQGGVDPDEFVQLEPVLMAAIAKAAPFTVTVETFGGTRQSEGTEGPIDGDAPPPPRQPPKSKWNWDWKKWGWKWRDQPKDAPSPGQEPKEPKEPGEDGKGAKKDKPLLKVAGFQQTLGKTTGIVLSADGWILVSRFALHLEPTTILITVPGRGTFHAERAGEDTSRGIALVKIDATDLPVPEFVAPETVRIGQWAFALGRTFGAQEPTVHIGIVSAKRRIYGRALQVDAYTSPANYGGPVVDLHGRVLGMAVPLSPSGRNAGVEWYDSGIGFAVTIADIPQLLARMQQGQVLQRGWLGVQLETAFLGPGAKIASTPPAGAAAKAGIQKGDVIRAVDGVAVRNGPHFQMLLSSHLGGDQVTLEVQQAAGPTVVMGPLVLLDAPWSEQQQKKDAELPASFSLPEKK